MKVVQEEGNGEEINVPNRRIHYSPTGPAEKDMRAGVWLRTPTQLVAVILFTRKNAWHDQRRDS